MQALMRQLGRSLHWPAGPIAANLPLYTLDRFAGKGFADMLVEQINSQPEETGVPPCADTRNWWKETLVYQIYLPSFMDGDHDGVGDLAGVMQRLPYLEKLGVETLWLCPLLDAPLLGERAACDFKAIFKDFGDMQQFEELAEALHVRGMRLVIGLDIASTSDQHVWFKKALETREGGYRDYYIFRKGNAETPPNNWGRPGLGPAWGWYEEAGAWALRLHGSHRMDLNWDNPAVRAEMQEVVRFWLQKGVDGFCFSSVGTISKRSYSDGGPVITAFTGARGTEYTTYGPQMHQYLRELNQTTLNRKDTLFLGEVRGIGVEMAKRLAGPNRGELDMVLDTNQFTAVLKAKENNSFTLRELKEYYLNWLGQLGGGHWLPLALEGPEVPRMISRVGASPVYRGILAKLLATLLLTLRGTPVIYQGQELGLANTRFGTVEELQSPLAKRLYADLCESLGEQAALQKTLCHAPDHARTPMPWSAGQSGGFTGAKPWMRLPDGVEYLNATVQMEDPNSVWGHYQKLIALRRQNECLIYGSFNPVFAKNKNVFCYFRILDGEKWYVEMNLTEKEIGRPGRILRTQHLVVSNYETQARTLRPYEANIYRCD